MLQNKKLIVANWKLNPLTAEEAEALASKIDLSTEKEVVLCPPNLFLTKVQYPNLGGQNCSEYIKGPYTGEISAAQLASLGAKYCIVGHSERRKMGETDTSINTKIIALLNYGIKPILCVGFGTSVADDELSVMKIVGEQLEQDLQGVDPGQVIVAYEPVWAIGTGRSATPDHAEQIALYISTKHHITKVLYGGSVNGKNAHNFLKQNHIAGLLVGGASLLADDFNTIIAS